jgi:hypothetical protein
MSLEWLKSVSARIEGRTAIMCGGLGFCGFALWLFVAHPLPILWISNGLILIVVVLASVIVLHTLFTKPQPSEPASQFLLQQIGNQLVYTGGFHSPEDLIRILREAHNIHPLPSPSAVVMGAPIDDKQYKPLSASEAEELQRLDAAGIEKMLRSEAGSILSTLQSAQLTGGRAEDTKKLSTKKSQS